MITKEQFVKLISDKQAQNKRLETLVSVFSSNILDCDLIEYENLLFETMLKFLFKSEAVDDIYWWLYEKSPDLKILDKDGKEMPTETIEDLWNIVKDYRK